MGFLGKNINFALVLLIMLVVLVAAGTTVLYQRGLKERTSQYESTNTNLSECVKARDNYKAVLQQKEQQLNETGQDIAKYGVIYDQKVSELQETSGELQSTKQQLTSMTLQKELYVSRYNAAVLNISSLKKTNAALEVQIDGLKEDIKDLKDDLDACEAG